MADAKPVTTANTPMVTEAKIQMLMLRFYGFMGSWFLTLAENKYFGEVSVRLFKVFFSRFLSECQYLASQSQYD